MPDETEARLQNARIVAREALALAVSAQNNLAVLLRLLRARRESRRAREYERLRLGAEWHEDAAVSGRGHGQLRVHLRS